MNAVITAALYPLYLRNLLRSIFFITNPKKPDDFALPESAIMFITVLIILIILCINIGMAIATNVCAVKKKGARPAAAFILYTCRGHKSADNCNAVKLDSDLQRYSGRNCNVRKHSVLLCVRSWHIHNDIQVEYFGLYLCGVVGNIRKSRKTNNLPKKSKCL